MEKKSPLILFVPYIILIVLILGFFYKVVLLNYNFFWRDILSHSYPAKKILIDSIIAGYFPLWNPYVSTGIPYLADLSNQSLYIFNILFLILPSSEAINFTILSHYILCAIFMYLFVKDLTENKYISIFAGVSFPLSGYCVSLNCNLEYLSAIIWLPAVFWSYYRVINTEKTIYLFLTALFLSMLIFGGEPMAFYYLLGFICLHCLFQLKDKKQLLKEAVLIIIICLGSLIISSVQLLPALEFASLSNRSGGLSFAEATIWSFNPLRLIEFILPFFYGHNFPYPRYWGTFLQAGTFNVPWAESVYIGVVPFFLALFSLYFSKTKEKFYWVSVILISLFLSFGCFTPIYKLLFNIIPMLSSFRYPEKIIIFATFGLIVLASLTLLDLFNNQEHKFPKYVLIVFTLPILITIICFFLDFSTIINLKNMAISGEVDRWFINFNTRFRLIYFSLILLSLAGSYLYIVKRLKKIEYFLIFIIIFTFLDLLNINSNAYLTTNVNFFTYKPVIENTIKNEWKEKYPPRVFLSKTLAAFTNPNTQYSNRKDFLNNFYTIHNLYWSENFIPNRSIMYGIGSFNSVYSLDIKDVREATTSIFTDNTDGFFRDFNINYILSSNFNFIDFDKYADRKIITKYNTLLQLDNITPRAFIVQNAKHYNNLTDIKNQFHLSDFNIRNTILLEGKSSKEKVIISTADTADVVHYSNNKVVIDTNLRHDGYLVLLDAFYPGWKIYVDNKEAQIIKADLIYRAVKLSSGKHKVVFLFDPVLLKIGLAITIIGIILLTGLLFKYKEIKWN